MSVDPLAEKYPSLSPYNYVANNPIIHFDIDGRDFYDANTDKYITPGEAWRRTKTAISNYLSNAVLKTNLPTNLDFYHRGYSDGNYDVGGVSNDIVYMGEYAGVDRRDAIQIFTSKKDMDRSISFSLPGEGSGPEGGVIVKDKDGNYKMAPAIRFYNSSDDEKRATLITISYSSEEERDKILESFGWMMEEGKLVQIEQEKEHDDDK